MRLLGLRPIQDAAAGAGVPHRGGPRPRCYHPGPGLGRSERLPRLPGPSPRRPRPSDRLPRPGRHPRRLMAMTQLRAAANADAARWLRPADVDWWDLVRYRPPGFDVYVCAYRLGPGWPRPSRRASMGAATAIALIIRSPLKLILLIGRTPSGATTRSATRHQAGHRGMTPGPGRRGPDCGRSAGRRDRVAASRPAPTAVRRGRSAAF